MPGSAGASTMGRSWSRKLAQMMVELGRGPRAANLVQERCGHAFAQVVQSFFDRSDCDFSGLSRPACESHSARM